MLKENYGTNVSPRLPAAVSWRLIFNSWKVANLSPRAGALPLIKMADTGWRVAPNKDGVHACANMVYCP